MLRKTMIVLATTAALTAGLTVESLARGGGSGGHGGGFGGGGAHTGGGLGGAHMSGGGFSAGHFEGQAFGRGTADQRVAGARGYVDRDGHFDHHGRHGRGFIFGPGSDYDFYDYGCGYPYYRSAGVVCPPADLE